VPKPQLDVGQRTARDICLAIVRSYRPECLDELLELLAPDIEWTTTETWIERGHRAATRPRAPGRDASDVVHRRAGGLRLAL
jgi:hypothetical protein